MKERDFIMHVNHRPPITIVRGQGSELWDDTGRRYLDMVQGWAVNGLGHAPEVVHRVLCEQSRQLLTASPAFNTEVQRKAARAVADATRMDRVFFATSGAEANEGAIKLARKYGALHRDGAYEIITLRNGFHGRTLTTMAASGKAGWQRLFPPQPEGFVHAEPNDFATVVAAVNERTVAVLLELVQGEAGVVPLSNGFVQEVARLCRERGLLLMIDEIQTGSGRTGSFVASERYGIAPDVVTLGKGLGAGIAVSALVSTERVSCFEPGEQGGTFAGAALACAVVSEVVSILSDPEFLRQVSERGDYLKRRLQGLGLGDARGLGLLLALQVEGDAELVAQRALEKGLLLNAPNKQTLRFMPALNIAFEEIDEAVSLLERAL